MDIEFKPSENYTVGIEVEVQLIDKATLELSPSSGKVIDGLKGFGDAFKHEFLTSNIEINTVKSSTVKEATGSLCERFAIVHEETKRQGLLICCAGTHPFSKWRDQVMTDDPRYHRLLQNLQAVARRFNIFGLHVHVGVSDGERCIYIMNNMLFYLPHLLALSTNSPFWEGEFTGLKSFRTKVFESLPIAGLPFYFEDWDDYTRLVNNYFSTGTIETIRDLWWDIRPHPDFGTIEVRVCDTPGTVKEMAALAALVQALVKRFDDEYTRGVPFIKPHSAVIRENKWRACRYGLDAEFVTVDGAGTKNARDEVGALLASLDQEAGVLGTRQNLSVLEDVLTGTSGADRQIGIWKETGETFEVVKDLTESLSEDIKSGCGI